MGFLKGCSRGRLGLYARGDRGATAVEYALMVGFIAVVIIVGVTAFGLSVQGLCQMTVAKSPHG